MNGITSAEGYKIGNVRRILSFKICFIGWIYEFVGTLFCIATPFLRQGEMHNAYFVDAIMMFVGIPLIHLTNDDDIKEMIAEEGWYQGLKSFLKNM